MFEREIKFIYDFNLNRINKIGSYLTFEQLVSLEIHPAILKYISAEIDFLIFEDRQKLLHDSVFDYSGKKINNYFSLIDSEIKKSKKLSIEYIDKLLLHAISFTVNYLVRPRWTLSRFLFDKDESKSTAEVKQIINYVYFYNYLTDTLASYLDKKKLISVEQTDIDELIKKIDDFAIESYLPNIIGAAVNSMSEFFSIGTVQQNRVPINAVKLFLQEKDLDEHIKKLEDTFEHEEKTKYITSDLLNALSSEELIYNLKAMETEQIDEDELEAAESIEFEPVEIEETTSSDTKDIADFPHNDPIEMDETSNLPIDDFQTENEVPEQVVSKFSENEKDLTNDVNITTELEKIVSNENIIENTQLDKSPDFVELESSAESAEREFTASTNENTLNAAVTGDDKFEFEKVEQESENLTVDSTDNPVEDMNETHHDESGSNLADNEEFELQEEDDEQGNNFEWVSDEVDKFENDNTDTEQVENKNIAADEFQTDEIQIEEIQTGESIKDELITDNEITEPNKKFDSANDVIEETVLDNNEDTDTMVNVEDESGAMIEKEQNWDLEDDIGEESKAEDISGAIDEMETDVFEGKNTVHENETNEEEGLTDEKPNDNSPYFGDVDQPELFPRAEIEIHESESIDLEGSDEDTIKEEKRIIEDENSNPQIELSDLLENKNMNKILKVIFDYDMDDFVNAIDSISECKTEEDASKILQTIYKTNGIKQTSKEAKAFVSIITEYFKKK